MSHEDNDLDMRILQALEEKKKNYVPTVERRKFMEEFVLRACSNAEGDIKEAAFKAIQDAETVYDMIDRRVKVAALRALEAQRASLEHQHGFTGATGPVGPRPLTAPVGGHTPGYINNGIAMMLNAGVPPTAVSEWARLAHKGAFVPDPFDMIDKYERSKQCPVGNLPSKSPLQKLSTTLRGLNTKLSRG